MNNTTHKALYHMTRAPKYLAKLLFWAPVGGNCCRRTALRALVAASVLVGAAMTGNAVLFDFSADGWARIWAFSAAAAATIVAAAAVAHRLKVHPPRWWLELDRLAQRYVRLRGAVVAVAFVAMLPACYFVGSSLV
jgi:hypothetical protein